MSRRGGVWKPAAGFGRGLSGVWQPGFSLNPANKNAGQTAYNPPRRGLAGFEVESYAHARARVRAYARDRKSNPAKPRKPRSTPLTCEDIGGVWPHGPLPNPAAKPR